MAATTSAKSNKALVRQLYEAINEKDDDKLFELYASDCVIHDAPGEEGDLTGHDALEQVLQGTRAAFPDMTTTVEAMVAEDDLVAARIAYTATHEDEYLGVPATGESVSFKGMNLFRIDGGQIVEVWPLIDTLSVMQQLGAIEVPAG